jgi:hypothetical protein
MELRTNKQNKKTERKQRSKSNYKKISNEIRQKLVEMVSI